MLNFFPRSSSPLHLWCCLQELRLPLLSALAIYHRRSESHVILLSFQIFQKTLHRLIPSLALRFRCLQSRRPKPHLSCSLDRSRHGPVHPLTLANADTIRATLLNRTAVISKQSKQVLARCRDTQLRVVATAAGWRARLVVPSSRENAFGRTRGKAGMRVGEKCVPEPR